MEIKPQLGTGRTVLVLRPLDLQSNVDLVLQVIWEGRSWFGQRVKWSPWWSHCYVSSMSPEVHLTETHADHKYCPPEIQEGGRISSLPIWWHAYFMTFRVNGTSGHLPRISDSLEPRVPSCIWRDELFNFEAKITLVSLYPLKGLGDMDGGDQQGHPQTGMEGKSLCEYLVPKLLGLKVSVHCFAAKRDILNCPCLLT